VILNASGCLDALTAPEVARELDAFVSKTIMLAPREGNPPPRIAETDAGMLNSIGLPGPGIDVFVADHLPVLERLGVLLWVSVGGFSADEYGEICARLDEQVGVAALELNLSCPNVEGAPETAAEIVAACRAVTAKPLYAKLSAAQPDLAAAALAVRAAGADGLSLINTMRGLALDEGSLRPRLGRAPGGYSGAGLRPIALAAVFICYRATGGTMPIVGMGGIESGRHALEFVAAGASAVALGTVLFADPGAPSRVREELAAELAAHGLERLEQARGLAHAESVSRIAPASRPPGRQLP
jgi:dihydroorotate dehydrogenase (NAD+) catalytic subunit